MFKAILMLVMVLTGSLAFANDEGKLPEGLERMTGRYSIQPGSVRVSGLASDKLTDQTCSKELQIIAAEDGVADLRNFKGETIESFSDDDQVGFLSTTYQHGAANFYTSITKTYEGMNVTFDAYDHGALMTQVFCRYKKIK